MNVYLNVMHIKKTYNAFLDKMGISSQIKKFLILMVCLTFLMYPSQCILVFIIINMYMDRDENSKEDDNSDNESI